MVVPQRRRRYVEAGEREQISNKIRQDRIAARTAAFNQWMGSEEGQALMQKYGLQPVIYNNDGDQFKWTGSGYQKTIRSMTMLALVIMLRQFKICCCRHCYWSVIQCGVLCSWRSNKPNWQSWGAAGQILGQILGGGAGGTAGGIAYEDAMDALNNPNVIVNLQDEFGAQNGIDNEDGTRRYSDWNLEGYIYSDAKNAVIHVASGREYQLLECMAGI